ncbi:MAG: hypothetical protein ACYDBS_02900, partial [Acidimicrobiales bacterium]
MSGKRYHRARGRVAKSFTALAAVVLMVCVPAVFAFAAGTLPPHNPKHNIAPVPNFDTGSCRSVGSSYKCFNPCLVKYSFPVYSNAPACTNYVLRAINAARKQERVWAMRLPSNWHRLTPAEQLFVLADLERVSRGLPPYIGLNTALNKDAQYAAVHDEDPTIARGFPIGIDPQGAYGMGGSWADGFSTLTADYGWMYNDGWGGRDHTFNIACTSPNAAGCW